MSNRRNTGDLTVQQMYDAKIKELESQGWCMLRETFVNEDHQTVEIGVYGLGALIYTFRLIDGKCVSFKEA